MKKRFLLCVLLCIVLALNTVIAQTEKKVVEEINDTTLVVPKQSAASTSIGMPNYKESVLSPQTTLMNMYGDYPVDLVNGLVNISIPLYEIRTPHLKLPISIRFHASGLRANEQEGLLGVRWLLDATYSVNRQVKGYPDDNYLSHGIHFPFDSRVADPYYTPNPSTLLGTLWKPGAYQMAIPQFLLHKLSEHTGPASPFMDTAYDIFSYQLPSGKSGKFILRDSAGVKIPQTLPYEPIKIEISRPSSEGAFQRFTITDENGITYNYGKTIHLAIPEMNIDHWATYTTDAITTWNLNAIISANKKDTILFEYKFLHNLRIRNRIATAWDVKDLLYESNDFYSSGQHIKEPAYDFFYNEMNLNPANVTIDQPSGPSAYSNLSSISFKGGRIEFDYESLYGSVFISSMSVFNVGITPIRKLKFIYKQPNIPGTIEEKAVLLDKLAVLNPQNETSIIEEYCFDYYNPEIFPAGSTVQTETQSDWWGYFSRGGYNLIRETVPFHTISHGSYSQYTNTTIGETITGKNSSVYDMKTCMLKSIEYPTGGKSIFDYESNYYWNNNQVTPCGGLRIKSVENKTSTNGLSERKSFRYDMHTGSIGYGVMPAHLYPPHGNSKNFINETYVSAHFKWFDPTGWIGPYFYWDFTYASYLYSNVLPRQFNDFHSNIVYYNKVVEYIGTESVNEGYVEYTYSPVIPNISQYNHTLTPLRANENNSRQFIYVLPPKFGESQSQLQKKTVFNKHGQPLEESTYSYSCFNKGFLYDMPINRLWNYKLGGYFPQGGDARDEEIIQSDYHYQRDFAYINQEYRLGASRLTGEVTKTYTPGGIVTTSKTIEYDETYLLPIKETVSASYDKTNSVGYKYPHHYNTEPYTSMKARNILSPVIEKSIYEGNTFVEKAITNYKQWSAGVFSPLSFQHQIGNGTLETRLNYEYNSNNQLIAASKDATQRVVYIRNAYHQPVAVIDQKTYTQVQTALGATLINRIAASFVVSDADMAALANLRSTMPDAMVTTYTYKPLVGVTSVTDPRGITTYYTYDAMGRLKEIYMMGTNGKEVLEAYEYNYANSSN
ncbi:hypothetical protein D0T50_03985 [Bacteroides sp. 214]|uniref:RHS repeat domain-containing protein n=1 Tax=Bacteroides sp. 214 TaxID=2302935 RepID=UPI0013D8807A|nr:RHS repeat domain-containing protein [Bacteroides sp. 214]NDW12047.1 hypothetical protein [Bacteroides sp. 214]